MAVPSYVEDSDSGNLGSSITTLTHTLPGGWSVGDLCVAMVTVDTNRNITSTTSGFTQIGSSTSGLSLWWKILESGDLGASKSWTSNFSSFSGNQIVLIRITGHDATTPVNQQTVTTDGSAVTSHVTPSVTTTVDDCLILRCIASFNGVTVSSGDTGTNENNNYNCRIYRSSKTTAGATGTATYTTASGVNLAFGTIAIAPTSGGGGSAKPTYYHHQQQVVA